MPTTLSARLRNIMRSRWTGKANSLSESRSNGTTKSEHSTCISLGLYHVHCTSTNIRPQPSHNMDQKNQHQYNMEQISKQPLTILCLAYQQRGSVVSRKWWGIYMVLTWSRPHHGRNHELRCIEAIKRDGATRGRSKAVLRLLCNTSRRRSEICGDQHALGSALRCILSVRTRCKNQSRQTLLCRQAQQ